MSYTNITLCPQCGNITDDKCCNEDLILYESQHETFIDSIIPLIKEMSDDWYDNNINTNDSVLAVYARMCSSYIIIYNISIYKPKRQKE